MRAALVPSSKLAPSPNIQENLSRVRSRSDHDCSGQMVIVDEECKEETWSWWHFTPDQVDPYWIHCTLAGPHEEHEDETTGLTWKTSEVDKDS